MDLSIIGQAAGPFAVTNILPPALWLKAAWEAWKDHRNGEDETEKDAEAGDPGAFGLWRRAPAHRPSPGSSAILCRVDLRVERQ